MTVLKRKVQQYLKDKIIILSYGTNFKWMAKRNRELHSGIEILSKTGCMKLARERERERWNWTQKVFCEPKQVNFSSVDKKGFGVYARKT